MSHRAVRGWDEQDAYTPWRHLLTWRRGELKKIKRRTHKHERRDARVMINDQRAHDEFDRYLRPDDRDYE